jgi:hypothetical protein
MNNTINQTLGQVLRGRNEGVFVNDKGEFINVFRYYYKNTLKFNVIFSKNIYDIATRPAINTTSEKKVLKLLSTENYELVNQ